MRNYRKNAMEMAKHGVNICEAGVRYPVHMDMLKGKTKDALELPWVGEDGIAWFESSMIAQYDVPYDAVDWDDGCFSEAERDLVLSMLIKEAPHYLVVAHSCRWDGADGYKFASSPDDAFYRSYDATICPVTASKGGKVLITRECTHDRPTGGRTTVIALTEAEYERLRFASFNSVFEFAERLEEKEEV